MTKNLLIFASLAEGGFGLLLLAYPPFVARLLFAAEVSGAGVILARLTGMCLIALAIACWPSDGSRSAYYGMLTWSVLAMLYLVVVGIGGQAGILLWPAVAVHAALALLLVWAWRKKRQRA
jgi:hypothetical protein